MERIFQQEILCRSNFIKEKNQENIIIIVEKGIFFNFLKNHLRGKKRKKDSQELLPQISSVLGLMTGRYFPLIGATHSPPMKSSRAGISTSSPIVTLKTHTHKQRNSHSSVKTSNQPTQKQSKQSKLFQQKSHYENP